MRRVVVTGMGIVSSIGNNTQEVLASLREAKSGISRAEEYAKLGFRCQVHGAPTLDPADFGRPPRHAVPRRRQRPGTTSPWSRRSAIPGVEEKRHLERTHRHHHGFGRPLDARHRRRRRHHPRKGPQARRPVRGAEGDVVHRLGDARDLVQDQGRELFDLLGLRDVQPLHRQRLPR